MISKDRVGLQEETFRGRPRTRVTVDGRFIGLVRRAGGPRSRWLWVKGFGPLRSEVLLHTKAQAVDELVAEVAG